MYSLIVDMDIGYYNTITIYSVSDLYFKEGFIFPLSNRQNAIAYIKDFALSRMHRSHTRTFRGELWCEVQKLRKSEFVHRHG